MSRENANARIGHRLRRLAQILDEAARFEFCHPDEAHHFAVAIDDVRRALDLLALDVGLLAPDEAADVVDPLMAIVDTAERMAEASTRQFLRMVQWRRPRASRTSSIEGVQ
jgi:hypothetical protein